jgi:hypothetical protein
MDFFGTSILAAVTGKPSYRQLLRCKPACAAGK